MFRLRPRGHWDRHITLTDVFLNFTIILSRKSRFNLLKPKTFVAYKKGETYLSLRLTLRTTSFSIQKFFVLSTMHLYILRGSQKKQRFSLFTALPDRFYNRGRECLLSGTKRVFISD
jgi:hypothetical protein